MKLLAIDTATEACSVALWQDGAIVETFEVLGRTHSVQLPLMLPALLAEAGIKLAQLDGLVCGIGPGSFAGVRIGVSFVKGLALGLDRPVVGVTSLAMLAAAQLAEHPDALALPAIDARMDEVYLGAYRSRDGAIVAVQDDAVGPAGSIELPAALTGPIRAAGTGWSAHREALLARLPQMPVVIDDAALPHAAAAFRTAVQRFERGDASDAAQLVPAYLRNRVALTQREQQALRDSRGR